MTILGFTALQQLSWFENVFSLKREDKMMSKIGDQSDLQLPYIETLLMI